MIGDEPRLANTFQDRSVQRLDFVCNIVTAAKALFPQIEIRLLESIPLVNAQASAVGKRRTVDLFGGLIFHPALGPDALTFSLAHELGHHIAAGPRQYCGSILACDCAADAWATEVGFDLLSAGRTQPTIRRAVEELGPVVSAPNRKQVSPPRSSFKCWALDWKRRASALKTGNVGTIKTCGIFEIIQRRN